MFAAIVFDAKAPYCQAVTVTSDIRLHKTGPVKVTTVTCIGPRGLRDVAGGCRENSHN